MKDKLRIVQIGCGNMGAFLMRYAIESGADLIAAFGHHYQGKKVSEAIDGVDSDAIIYDGDELDAKLKELRPDCAIVATKSLMRDVKDTIITCAQNGVDVVTTADEAMYPWNSSPNITKEIDEVAKANNCTVIGSGFPDLSYCHLVAAEAGGAHKITKISGSASYNVDDYGVALADHHGAGFSKERFEEEISFSDKMSYEERDKLIEDGGFTAIPMWNANGWLCARLGLTVKSQKQVHTPLFSDTPLFSSTLGREISTDEAIGMSAKAITETEEGITIETESIGKVYAPGEVDTNDWVIYGEPDIYVSNTNIKNSEMICAEMTSRIVDAVNGPAGFLTTDQFGPARYLSKPINEYID